MVLRRRRLRTAYLLLTFVCFAAAISLGSAGSTDTTGEIPTTIETYTTGTSGNTTYQIETSYTITTSIKTNETSTTTINSVNNDTYETTTDNNTDNNQNNPSNSTNTTTLSNPTLETTPQTTNEQNNTTTSKYVTTNINDETSNKTSEQSTANQNTTTATPTTSESTTAESTTPTTSESTTTESTFSATSEVSFGVTTPVSSTVFSTLDLFLSTGDSTLNVSSTTGFSFSGTAASESTFSVTTSAFTTTGSTVFTETVTVDNTSGLTFSSGSSTGSSVGSSTAYSSTQTVSPSNASLTPTPNSCLSCSINAACLKFEEIFICSCNNGYIGNGTYCAPINYCATTACSPFATCNNSVNGAICTCLPNFVGNGYSCTLACSPTCVCAGNNSNQCLCNPGYFYNPVTYLCEDINECNSSSSNQCSANAACVNTIGSYNCLCNTGYSGNGKTCYPNLLVNVPVSSASALRSCDDCGQQINLGCNSIPFGGSSYSTIYVYSNGYITFGDTYFNTPNPSNSVSIPIVAPFWTDIDLSCGNGSVYYAVAMQGSSLLNSTYQVLQYSNNTGLQPIMAIIVTYQNVRPYPSCSYTTETMSMQLILLTDGFTTEIVVYYPNGLVNWSPSKYWRRILSGYGYGNGNLQKSYSFTSSINFGQSSALLPYNLGNSTGNTNQVGIWSYSVGQVATSSASYCPWLQSAVPVIALNTCPPSSTQASSDNRFVLSSLEYMFPYTWNWNYWWPNWFQISRNQYKVSCYVDAQWSQQNVFSWISNSYSSIFVKQQCCYRISYSTGKGSLITQAPLAGTMMTSNTSEYLIKQFIYNSNLPFSTWTNIRPISSSSKYFPPSVALFSGDPHIQTLDGASYTFNGLGEYVLTATTPSNGTSFVMQCRTALAGGQATAFNAFAMQLNGGDVIMLSYNLIWNGIDIFVNEVNQTLTFINQNMTALESAPPSAPPYRITVMNNAVTVTNSFCSVTVSVGYQSLSTTFNLPIAAQGIMQGLLGNFDGNANNDYIFPNGTTISVGSSETELFTFGQSWLINCSQTLFSYFNNQSCQGMLNASLNFTPLYTDTITPDDMLSTLFHNNSELMVGANATCFAFYNTSTYLQCMMDAGVTGNISAAASFSSSVTSFANAVTTLTTFPPIFIMPANITVYANTIFNISLTINASNIANMTVQSAGSINGTSGILPTIFNASGVYTLSWTINVALPPAFEVVATGADGQSATWTPNIYYCGCQNDGVCVPSSNTSTSTSQATVFVGMCQCPGLYSGLYCQNNPCNGFVEPCFPNVTCTVNGTSFSCGNCPTGYTGNGSTCIFDDPCLSAGCSYQCLSQPSANYNYTCTCPSGFQPDPVAYTNCTDVNECELSSSLCANYSHGMCVNTIGSYECSCTSGYQYFSTNSTCFDINECMLGDPCNASASVGCINTAGSYSCSCNLGYEASVNASSGNASPVCSAITYCSHNPSPCQYNCTDIPGSYYCSCPLGFNMIGEGANSTCLPIDLCAANVCGYLTCITLANGGYQCVENSNSTLNPEISTSTSATTNTPSNISISTTPVTSTPISASASTPSSISTATSTPSSTSTATSTPSSTATATTTPGSTSTATSTPSSTATATTTPGSTSTATSTPSSTSTATSTPSSTATATTTPGSTSTATLTPSSATSLTSLSPVQTSLSIGTQTSSSSTSIAEGNTSESTSTSSSSTNSGISSSSNSEINNSSTPTSITTATGAPTGSQASSPTTTSVEVTTTSTASASTSTVVSTTTIPISLTTCSCAQNAVCTPVKSANGSTAYQCVCAAGYYGYAYANGSCTAFNPLNGKVVSYNVIINITLNSSIYEPGSYFYTVFAHFMQVKIDQILIAKVPGYLAGSSTVTGIVPGSIITSMTSMAYSNANFSSDISSSVPAGLSTSANLADANSVLVSVGYAGSLSNASFLISSVTVLPACTSVACPSSTVCTSAENGTAQCLCLSNYTATGWINSYTQSCQIQSPGVNVVAIVLPIVFGVVAIQVVLFVICVVRRMRAKRTSERMENSFAFEDELKNSSVNADRGLPQINLPRPRFEYYRNPAINWLNIGNQPRPENTPYGS